MRTMPPFARIVTGLMVVLSLSLLAGCGSRQPDLEPPVVKIITLTINDGSGSARLRIDNPVAASMPAAGIEIALTLNNEQIGQFNPPLAVDIPPLGSETVTVELANVTIDTSAVLSFELDGSIRLESGKRLHFNETGRLYPTPGKPGSFR